LIQDPNDLVEYIDQVWHTDFKVDAQHNWFPGGEGMSYDPLQVPCTAMLGIDSTVKLKFCLGSWEKDLGWKFVNDFPNSSNMVCVNLEPGDIIIWRGDLYHCGVASKSLDYRLLAHVYTPSMRMVQDSLYNVFQC
jgi:hypothetical protein